MKALTQKLTIIDQGRFTILGIGIVSHIDLQYLQVLVVKIVGAFAVATSIHGLGEIDMWDGVKMDVLQIHKMVLTKGVHLHQGDKPDPGKAKLQSEIKHFGGFLGRIDVSFNQVAACIKALPVYSFKVERPVWDFTSI